MGDDTLSVSVQTWTEFPTLMLYWWLQPVFPSGYAVGSVISGSLVAKTGLAKTFLIWSAVAGVGCVLHGLYDKFVLRPNSEYRTIDF